jgi:hypothetical protein
MISIDFKATGISNLKSSQTLIHKEQISWEAPLKHYINQVYAEDPNKYNQDIVSLAKKRNDCVLDINVHPASISLLYRYYGQLVHINSKFPIDEAHIKILFNWTDVLCSDQQRSCNKFLIHFCRFNTKLLYLP